MSFAIIRLAPFLLPPLYLAAVEAAFYFSGFWLPLLLSVLALDVFYFWLVYLKTKNKKTFLFIFHSLIFLVAGFVFSSILSNRLFINSFLAIWSLAYLVYLEAMFHYFYPGQKIPLTDLKNVIAYVDLALIFLIAAFLLNFYLFLNLPWYFLLSIMFFVFGTVLASRLLVNAIELKRSMVHASVLAVLISEIAAVALFLPVSFYVSAMLVTVFYYLASSFSLLWLKQELTIKTLINYLVFSTIILSIIFFTAQWL